MVDRDVIRTDTKPLNDKINALGQADPTWDLTLHGNPFCFAMFKCTSHVTLTLHRTF